MTHSDYHHEKVIYHGKEYFRCEKEERAIPHNKVPVSGKNICANDIAAMLDSVLRQQYTADYYVHKFEKQFGKFVGTGNNTCLAVNSGSSANLIALSALMSPLLGDKRLTLGDEVITVAAGFPTTINPIIQLGLVPVFVDISKETLNIDLDLIPKAISPKTKAIFIAHTLGVTCDLVKLQEIAKKYHLWVIEDCCDAMATKFNGTPVGGFGDIATFSFYPAHHITTGEGGMVVTDNQLLYKAAKSLRDWGRDCHCDPGQDNACCRRFTQKHGSLPTGYDHKYVYSHLGYNCKMTEMQAALGSSQITRVHQFHKARQEHEFIWRSGLMEWRDKGYIEFIYPEYMSEVSWFGFPIICNPNKVNKHELVAYLESHGVATRPVFAGNYLRQPVIFNYDFIMRVMNSDDMTHRGLSEKHLAMLPNTDYILHNCFWVGLAQNLTGHHVEYGVSVFNKFFEGMQDGKVD